MAYARIRDFDGIMIPTSTTVQAYLCGSCNSVHLVGFDEEGEPLFEIVVSKDVHNTMSRLFKELE